MIGVICGDVIGSIYEVLEVRAIKEARRKIEGAKKINPNFDETSILRHRTYDERIKIMEDDLFPDDITYTDDTVLAVALCDALLHDKDYKAYLLKYGKDEIKKKEDMYGRARFGKGFTTWLNQDGVVDTEPSFGNGSAMRVAPIGWAFDTLEETLEEAKRSAEPSHGHEEGIKGAQAVAASIFLARNGLEKEEIKSYVEETFGYNLNKDLDELRNNYYFNSSCQGSVPEAIFCFLESDGFTDSIRKAISIGGDSDTIAAMTGAISEAYYGLDAEIAKKCMEYVPNEYLPVLKDFYEEVEPTFDFDSIVDLDEENTL